MSSAAEIAALIARLEAATGPDRDLDAAIESERRRQQAYACGLNDKTRAYWVPDKFGYVESQRTRYPAKHFTASIDAALTLVPEGAIRHIEWCEGFVEVAVFTERYSLAHGAAPTPALAIVIAALRAKGEGA